MKGKNNGGWPKIVFREGELKKEVLLIADNRMQMLNISTFFLKCKHPHSS